MGLYGATREHLATFIVRNRANGAENPNAVFYQQPITRDDYLNTRMVAEPLSLLDCDMPVDGCGAIILTTAERARDLKQKPVYVSGCTALGIAPQAAIALTLEDFMTSSRRVAKALWTSAQMTTRDIAHAQLYDGFSYFPYLWLEAFGFYPEGEAYLGIQDDTTSQRWKTPTEHGRWRAGHGPTARYPSSHRSRPTDPRASRTPTDRPPFSGSGANRHPLLPVRSPNTQRVEGPGPLRSRSRYPLGAGRPEAP